MIPYSTVSGPDRVTVTDDEGSTTGDDGDPTATVDASPAEPGDPVPTAATVPSAIGVDSNVTTRIETDSARITPENFDCSPI